MSAAVYLDKAKTHLLAYDRDLALDKYDLLNTAHEKTGQPRIYIVLAATTILLIITTAIFGLPFLSNLIAFYPLYQSFKALRTPSPTDDQHWLTYWSVYGTLGLIESLLIGTTGVWLPFYYLLKIVFLVWCFHPKTKGALIVYQRVMAPLFGQLQVQVDGAEKELEKEGNKSGAKTPTQRKGK